MSSDIAIKVDDLSKCYQIYDHPQDRLKQMLARGRKQYYQDFWALKGVSFEIKKGETVGIIGRNGSGKSTLLQMICGTLNPTSGLVQAQGKVAALLELGSGFNPEFSGRENIYLYGSILGMSKNEMASKLIEILAFSEIGDFIDQPVKTYSSGMYVRLAFSVIAHVNADILIIDEALSVGDAFFTQKCMRFLRNFKDSGTLIFVSHDASAVLALCDRAVWLNKGCIKSIGVAEEVVTAYHSALYATDDAEPLATETEVKTPLDPARGFTSVLPSETIDGQTVTVAHPNLSTDIGSKFFGSGKAKIVSVKLMAADRSLIMTIKGSEIVTLSIDVFASEEVSNLIVGFGFKDRLGQVLFGANTADSNSARIKRLDNEQKLTVEFEFLMPTLQRGAYVLSAAVASGTQEQHIQHHWIHDALAIESVANSMSTGLVGIPMRNINLIIN